MSKNRQGVKLNINKNNGPIIIKLVLIGILALFLVFIYSRENAKDVNLADVESDMLENTPLMKSMVKQSERDVLQYYGLDSNDYSQIVSYRNTTALSVEELLIIKCKDRSQVPAVREAVDARIDNQIKVYESYGPEQVKLLKNAELKTRGNYCFYCTSPDASKYKEVFINAI